MGILNWLFGSNDSGDEQENHDTPYWLTLEDDEDASDYEKGAAFARAVIDHDRQHYQERGQSSFREAVEIGGEAWHRIVQQEEYLVSHGHPERQARLDYARGARSVYD
jgi:hypothetical protein